MLPLLLEAAAAAAAAARCFGCGTLGGVTSMLLLLCGRRDRERLRDVDRAPFVVFFFLDDDDDDDVMLVLGNAFSPSAAAAGFSPQRCCWWRCNGDIGARWLALGDVDGLLPWAAQPGRRAPLSTRSCGLMAPSGVVLPPLRLRAPRLRLRLRRIVVLITPASIRNRRFGDAARTIFFCCCCCCCCCAVASLLLLLVLLSSSSPRGQ